MLKGLPGEGNHWISWPLSCALHRLLASWTGRLCGVTNAVSASPTRNYWSSTWKYCTRHWQNQGRGTFLAVFATRDFNFRTMCKNTSSWYILGLRRDPKTKKMWKEHRNQTALIKEQMPEKSRHISKISRTSRLTLVTSSSARYVVTSAEPREPC